MKIFNTLTLRNKPDINIYFGIPENEKELELMFKLRFNVYKERNYIDPNKFKNELDIDEYDKKNKCEYFIAKIEDQIIGSARIIKDDPLPTELYFKFETPHKMQKIDPSNRAEIGRLVVTPYKINNFHYLPRHIIMLFLFKTIMDYSKDKNYEAGYSFIKSKLFYKLRKLNFPFYVIDKYEQKYPTDGVLYRYFNDPSDPVLPIYYFRDEVEKYFEKILGYKLIFYKKSDREYIFKNSFIYKMFIILQKFFKFGILR
jgi:N-acyl-L-homoserine lactone synthetase